MKGRIVHLEPDGHTAVQKLLPWYITGRLEADEVMQVDAHLSTCDVCRAELDIERRGQRLLVNADDAPSTASADADAGWAAMQMRIAEADAHARTHADGAASRLTRGRRQSGFSRPAGVGQRTEGLHRGWLRAIPVGRSWAVPALLSVALASVLVFKLYPRDGLGGEFRALAATSVEGTQVLVRFRPEASEAEIRRSLKESGARLVDGPTVTDAYVVQLPRDRYQASVDLLRKSPSLLLVESLEPEAKP